MRTDEDIRRDVESELQWDPSVGDSTIRVVVRNGVVTLTGRVGHYGGRWAAEGVTQRVKGVRAIANEIQVNILQSGARSDTDIADAAADALRWNVSTTASPIQCVVQDGFVTLSGKVDCGFQKTAAESAVRNLIGVKGLINSIVMRTMVRESEVKREREDAARVAWAAPGVGHVDNRLH